MLRLIIVTVAMLIITCYALLAEMQITQTGFYPNDSFNNTINCVKEMDGILIISDQNKSEITLPENLITSIYILTIESNGKMIRKEKFIIE